MCSHILLMFYGSLKIVKYNLAQKIALWVWVLHLKLREARDARQMHRNKIRHFQRSSCSAHYSSNRCHRWNVTSRVTERDTPQYRHTPTRSSYVNGDALTIAVAPSLGNAAQELSKTENWSWYLIHCCIWALGDTAQSFGPEVVSPQHQRLTTF